MSLPEEPLNLSGRNWGTWAFTPNGLHIRIDDKEAIQLPLSKIKQTSTIAKNEFGISIQEPDIATEGDSVIEMRFTVIPASLSGEESIRTLKELIQDKTAISRQDGNSIASFVNVGMLIPRGRFDMEFSRTRLRLHGKSYDYSIDLSNITQLYRLPQPMTPTTLLLLNLQTPLLQGQTRYFNVLLQLELEKQVELDLKDRLSEAELDKVGWGETARGALPDVLTKIVQVLTNKPIKQPLPLVNDFETKHCTPCGYKASNGQLYVTAECIIFVVKPLIIIPLGDIACVEFSIGGSGLQTRFFNLRVSLHSGKSEEFTAIPKTDHQCLLRYFESHQVRIAKENLVIKQQLSESLQQHSLIAPAAESSVSEEEEDDDEDFSEKDLEDAEDVDDVDDVDDVEDVDDVDDD